MKHVYISPSIKTKLISSSQLMETSPSGISSDGSQAKTNAPATGQDAWDARSKGSLWDEE